MSETPTSKTQKLLTARQLIDELWPLNPEHKERRPSVSWIRELQNARSIPFVRLGRRVFFDPDMVCEALKNQTTMKTFATK